MPTADDGGGASSSYAGGGGGAGGKLRKPTTFRRQSTPYERPLSAINTNTNPDPDPDTASWLTKLVVDPASKLISYGTDRFFSSVFRKRLPPPHLPEMKNDASETAQGVTDNDKDNIQEPTNSSFKSNGTFELEQLLKQKTFSRSEITRLTELLQSRAPVDNPNGDAGEEKVESALPFGRYEQFERDTLAENKRKGAVFSSIISTPVSNSKVHEDTTASPAELAKAYMGSRPSKVSPSMLGMRYHVGRDDTGMLSSVPFTSKSPSTSLVKKTSTGVTAPGNSFLTPRPRGRSAIYSMARTPYSRFHTDSILKGSGSTNNGNAGPGPSMSWSRTLVDHDENFERRAMTLKRRSSVLDDDIGSVGPIRRIRQKTNLLALRVYNTVYGGRNDHHSKLELQLTGKPENTASKSVVESENESGPSTSYAHVPFKSSEVAARILQNLEKLTPKERSSKSKLKSIQEKSPFKLTPSMLSGRALRSMENVDSSKFLDDSLMDDKLGSIHDYTLCAGGDSSSTKPKKVEENVLEGSIVPSDYSNPVTTEDSTASLRASRSSTKTTDAVVDNSAPQPPPKKSAFRMSAHEVSLEQDDGGYNDEITPALFSEKVSSESPLADNFFAPIDVSKSVKTSIQLETNPSSCFASSSKSELDRLSTGPIGVGGSCVVFPASEEETATAQQPVCPLSEAAFVKPMETNSHNPLLSFSSKVADRSPDQPSHSGNGAEDNLERSHSMVSIPVLTGSQVKTSESDTPAYLNLKARDVNEKSVTDPSDKWSLPSGLGISSADRNQISTNDTLQLTSSPSISNSSPLANSVNNTIPSSGGMFGLIEKPPNSAGPVFKFGATVDQFNAVSAASAANTGIADVGAKAEISPSSNSSSSSHFNVTALTGMSYGSSNAGLALTSHSTGSSLQGSLFSGATKSLVFGAGATVSQGTSASPQSCAADCTSSSSQLSIPGNIFGVNSSEATAAISGTVQKSNEFKFGESPDSVAAAVISSNGVPASVFGFNANSPSTTAVGLSSSALIPKFSFGGSAISTSATTTAPSLSKSTPTINFGGSSSTSAVTAVSSVDDPSPSNWQIPKSPVFGSGTSSALPSTGISFGASTSAPVSSSPVTAFTFGASTSAPPASSVFSFGLSSSSAAMPSPSTAFALEASSSSPALMPSSSPAVFSFGASSTSSVPALSPSPSSLYPLGASSTSAASVPSPSPNFSFGLSSAASAPSNAAPLVFNSSSAASSSPFFSFTAASASVLSSPSMSINQPVFGNAPVGAFAAPSGNNNDQMNGEDSMAEDPVLSSAPPVFGQASAASPVPPAFTFGSAAPSQPNPFMFGSQQNQVTPQNPPPFQASSSLEFGAGGGGSFSLGSGGGDKSNRKFVKIRNKNRKK